MKVIEKRATRKRGYGLLFAFNSNYGSILYHFRDEAKCLPKNPVGIFP